MRGLADAFHQSLCPGSETWGLCGVPQVGERLLSQTFVAGDAISARDIERKFVHGVDFRKKEKKCACPTKILREEEMKQTKAGVRNRRLRQRRKATRRYFACACLWDVGSVNPLVEVRVNGIGPPGFGSPDFKYSLLTSN